MTETYIIYWQSYAPVVTAICKLINDPRAVLEWWGLLKSWTIGSSSFLWLFLRLKKEYLAAVSKVCAIEAFPLVGEFRFPVVSFLILHPTLLLLEPPGLGHCPPLNLFWGCRSACSFFLHPLSPGISPIISPQKELVLTHLLKTPHPSLSSLHPLPQRSSDGFFLGYSFLLKKKKNWWEIRVPLARRP